MGIYWTVLFTEVTHQMEAEELTWHSDHTNQEVLDLTIAAATIGATQDNPIEISSDDDSEDWLSASLSEHSIPDLTPEEWDEYFAAGDEASGDLDTVAKTRGRDCDHWPDGNVTLLPSIGARAAMIDLEHHLQIRTGRALEMNKTILYCTKCAVLTDACLTDAQIRLVAHKIMPAMYRSITSKRQDTGQTMIGNLRMIVRLFMMDASGVDKIGRCLAADYRDHCMDPIPLTTEPEQHYDLVADLKPDPVPAYSCVPTPYSRDLEHFD